MSGQLTYCIQHLDTLCQCDSSGNISPAIANILLSLSCSEIILSGSNMLRYEGNAWVMYFANDSVAGVFGAGPQIDKESSPSTDKEATAHREEEAGSLTDKKTETQTDTNGQVCRLIRHHDIQFTVSTHGIKSRLWNTRGAVCAGSEV